MSVGFRAVEWNRIKVIYDAIVLAGVILYVGGCITVVSGTAPPKNLAAAISLHIDAFAEGAMDVAKRCLDLARHLIARDDAPRGDRARRPEGPHAGR
jgi:hypothetical protein